MMKTKKVKKAKKVPKVKKVDPPSEKLEFDEESIKNRISDMLENFKKKGGVLELKEGEEEEEDEDEVNEKRKKSKQKPTKKGKESRESVANGDHESNQDDTNTDDNDEQNEQDDNEDDTNIDDAEDGDGKADEGKKKREKKKKFDFERNSRTIFVGNLPTTYDQKSVKKLFKSCGPIETARIRSIVPEKEKLSPKVAMITGRIHPKVTSFNAYVVFKSNENNECVSKALKMNGKLIDGHHIRVDIAQRPRAKKETLTSRKKSIFVGNLRYDLRDDELINHFKKVGPVNYVRLVRDRSSGLGKGFGFVVFNDRASVKKALELNESQFKGRSIRVKKVE